MNTRLDLDKIDIHAEFENNLGLYYKALEDINMALAYKHLIAAIKLKNIYAFTLDVSSNKEKVTAYLLIAKLFDALGDLAKRNSFVHKAKIMALNKNIYAESDHFAKTHTRLRCPDGVKILHHHTQDCEDISMGNVFLLDQVTCRLMNIQEKNKKQFTPATSDYAICLASSGYKCICYLIHAKKIIEESKTFIRYHGIDVSADFNFMPSESGRISYGKN